MKISIRGLRAFTTILCCAASFLPIKSFGILTEIHLVLEETRHEKLLGATKHVLPLIPGTDTNFNYLIFFIPDSYLVPFENINVLLPAGQYTLKDENGLFSDSFTLVYNRVFGNPANPHNGDVYARIGNFVSDEGDVSLREDDEFFDQHSGPVVKPFDSPLGIGGISNFAVSIPSDSSINISSPREFLAPEHGTTGILLGVGMVFLMVVRKTWFKDFGT